MVKLARLVAAACFLLPALAAPALAEEADLRAGVAAFVQPDSAARTAALIDLLDREGLAWTAETFAGGNDHTGPMEGRNIIVTLGEGDREILLTAHYDAARLAGGELADGVVDNAASVVALVETLKALRGRPLEHRVRAIFLDQEELGLLGAHRWVEAHGVGNVAAVINSDIAAYGDALMYGENNGAQSAPVLHALRRVCADRAMTCIGYPSYPPSDDRVFIAAGVPTVSVGFQDRVGAHQTWLAFNGGENAGLAEGFVPEIFTVIHSDRDVMDRVDPVTIAAAAETYTALVLRLDAELE